MNKDGDLTDVTGNPLSVGFQVQLVAGYNCCYPGNPQHGTGTVEVLHKGGDKDGCASVVWRKGGRRCLVPDKALRIVAKRLPFAKPKELYAFALYLLNHPNVELEHNIPLDVVERMVGEYIVGKMEVPE